MSNIPTTNNNVLKNTNIYGGLAVLDNPNGTSIGRVYIQRDAKIDGSLVVNNRLIDASFIDSLDTISSVNNKIAIATQSVSQQANNYTDNKIAELIGTADDSLNSIQELATAIQNNSSLVDSIYSVIGSKTTLGEVQDYLETNYYDKPTTDTKLSETLSSAQTNTSQAIAPILSDVANLKIKINQKISYPDMVSYVSQNTYSKTEVDTKSIDTLSQANQYTNTAIQNITGYETTTSVNSKLEQLQLQINQKANSNNPAFTGTVTGVTKGMVGLGNVNNTSDLNKPISTATSSALSLKANINNPTFTGVVSGITKTMVGLSDVDNTSDLSKPISVATQNALNLKASILNPTFTSNVTVNGTLTTLGNIKINTDASQTKFLSFNQSNEVFGYYRDNITNIWGFDGSGNLFINGGINAQSNSTFNKTVTINEDASNMNLLLANKGKPSRLYFLVGSENGNYNPIVETNDSSIIYDNGTVTTGALNICNWSSSANGIKLTNNLTKVFGNFEVSNGSIVGSPIFRPTGNAAFGLGDNVYNSNALLQPLIYNGITNGTGNGASYSQFNVSFNSWNGTGFVCSSNNTCNAYLDHTNGNFSTKGLLSCSSATVTGTFNLSGNLNMNTSDIFARSMALSNNLYVTNVNANDVITSKSTIGTLNISGRTNFTHSNYSERQMNGLGYLKFADVAGSGVNDIFQIVHSGVESVFVSYAPWSQYSFRGTTSSGTGSVRRLNIVPNANGGNYNITTGQDDILIFGAGSGADSQSLNLSVWSSTATGLRIQPTKTTMTGGSNSVIADSSLGIQINGNTKTQGHLEISGGDLTLNGNININKTTKVTKVANFIPNNILDYSFPKTLGTSSLLVGYISVSDFQKSISFTIPLSVFRKYRNITTNNMTNYLEDSVVSVTYTILKNNQFFASGTCTATETLPKMVSVNTSNSTASRNYEIYMTNVGLSFIPSYEIGASSIYTITLNVNYTVNITDYASSNLIIESFGYYANTELATSNIQIYTSSGSTTHGAYYAPTSFTLGFISSSYYTEGNGTLTTNSVVSNSANVRDTLVTKELISQQATFTDKVTFDKEVVFSNSVGVKLYNGLAGYHIDGLANYISTPIFCSLRNFSRPNTDDFWFVNAGFKIEIYNSNDYLYLIKSMDNTNGTTAAVYMLNDTERNRTESFRVYFLNKEITFWPLS